MHPCPFTGGRLRSSASPRRLQEGARAHGGLPSALSQTGRYLTAEYPRLGPRTACLGGGGCHPIHLYVPPCRMVASWATWRSGRQGRTLLGGYWARMGAVHVSYFPDSAVASTWTVCLGPRSPSLSLRALDFQKAWSRACIDTYALVGVPYLFWEARGGGAVPDGSGVAALTCIEHPPIAVWHPGEGFC
ncbi:hypothetical protein LZ30DRAFT_215949 [Colletotrichum cereale]|nr:hypothetical protein LZ30DRAFT_215949 [Colletotrichum cereale]